MNKSLFEVLCEKHPESSRNTVRQWLKQGRITVDGERAKFANTPVAPEQNVILVSKAHRDQSVEGIRILFEDHHIVVVEKPAGLLTVAPDVGDARNLHSILKERCKPHRVYPVHRLDKGTSGLLIFAKNSQAREVLKERFAKHIIERVYVAVVEGLVEGEGGTWEGYLWEDKNFKVRSGKEPGARFARTHYTVVERGENMTLLRLKLETGRKNQIRVHSAEAGHPVAGDQKYGADAENEHRLALHAGYLGLEHPVTGEKLTFESPMPKNFRRILKGA